MGLKPYPFQIGERVVVTPHILSSALDSIIVTVLRYETDWRGDVKGIIYEHPTRGQLWEYFRYCRKLTPLEELL